MAIKAKSLIGIDIGSRQLKIVKSKAGKVAKVAIGEIPEGVLDASYIQSKSLLSDIISSTMRRAGISGGKCALCLSNAEVIIRVFEFPDMGRDELKENVLYEISDHLPVDLDRYTVDYRVLEEKTTESGKTLLVYVAAIPTELLRDYIRVLSKSNLKVEYIDLPDNTIEKIMLLSSYGNINYFKDKSIAIIDFGAVNTKVSILKEGVFAVSKVVNTGIDKIIKETSSYVSESQKTLQKKVYEGNIFYHEDSVAKEIFIQNTGSLTTEIAQALEFYNSRNRSAPLVKIYLMGGNSLIPGLKGYLSDSFGNIPVADFSEMLISWSAESVSKSVTHPLNVWACAYGATLRKEV